MATASTAIEVPVFIDTSLGTHILLSISPHLTAAEFKRIFESMHSNCYPGIGNIKVDGLMVKRKSCFYHLPESMPIKCAFRRSKKAWFLYTKVYPVNNKIPSRSRSEVVQGSLSDRKDYHSSSVEPTSERISESISVSGIIKKYFSVYDDEVTSSNSKSLVPNYAPKTPPSMTNVGGSRDKKKLSGVGKRLIISANNLGISTSDKKPMISLCKYKCDKVLLPESSSRVRHPVFEFGKKDYM